MAKETEDQIEARMEAARNKLSQEVQDKFNKEGDVDERDRRMESAARLRRTEPVEKAAPAAKAKSGVVTKEQLAKSGFDNLRDYMNAEKGLKRRDGSKTEKAPSKTTTETKPVVSKSADKPSGLMAKADKPAVSSSYRSEGANKAKPAESGNATRFLTGSKKPEPYNPPAVKFFKSLRARGEKDLAERGMKKGGSINGIAKRGLTKCKTV